MVGLAALVICLSFATAAFAYFHITNSTYHGLGDTIVGPESRPYAQTDPPGSQPTTAEVRHYFDDGSFNIQCSDVGSGWAHCVGTGWGSAMCQKRYVGGADGYMSRHWVRWSTSCSGQTHA
jgi:hypothetical protein